MDNAFSVMKRANLMEIFAENEFQYADFESVIVFLYPCV